MSPRKLDWTIRHDERGSYLEVPGVGAKWKHVKIEGLDCARYADGVDMLEDTEISCISGPDANGQWFVGEWSVFHERELIFGVLNVFSITSGPFPSARVCFAAAKILEFAK